MDAASTWPRRRRDPVHVQPWEAERRELARARDAATWTGDAAAATWIFREDELIDAAAATWIFRGDWVADVGVPPGAQTFNIGQAAEDYDPNERVLAPAALVVEEGVPARGVADPSKYPRRAGGPPRCVVGSRLPKAPFKFPRGSERPVEVGGRGGGRVRRARPRTIHRGRGVARRPGSRVRDRAKAGASRARREPATVFDDRRLAQKSKRKKPPGFEPGLIESQEALPS